MTAYVIAAVLICLLTSCTAAVDNQDPTVSTNPTSYEAPQIPTATPAPTATPKSAAQINAELETELEQAIRDAMHFDIAALLPEGEGVERLVINLFNHSDSLWILSIRDEVSSAIEAAVTQAEGSFSSGQELVFENQLTAPSWQYLYMIVQLAGEDVTECNNYIKSSMSVQVSVESEGAGGRVTACVEPIYYRDAILSVTGDDKIAYLEAESAYDYMNTVFDENIAEKEYVLPPAEGNLAAGITWPLERFTRLRKTWYAARDSGARKHTGTDIWAPEGAEIYSCTGGTVFYIGYWGGGGNSVVVVDDYGYMFYYHHMVRLTDFLQEGQYVEVGQLIGHVGNTGSSSRNHLHLTIVHPDGSLVNPYTVLLGAKPD